MAKKTKLNVGDKVTFKGYDDEVDDPQLKEGDTVYIKSFNDEDGSFNVAKTAKGKAIETLIESEVEVASDKKPAKKKTATKKATAKKTTAKKQAKKKVEPEVEAEVEEPEEEVEEEEEKESPVKLKKTASVTKIIKAEGDAITAALSMISKREMTDFTLGGVLAVIEDSGDHESILGDDEEPLYQGFKGFGQFVEHHLGFGYRKAKYLMEIYKTFTGLGVTEVQISKIGWSKLKEMCGVITLDNKDELISLAKSKPYDEFSEEMKDMKVDLKGGSSKESTAKGKRISFRVFEDQAEVMDDAVAEAMSQNEIDPKSPTALSEAYAFIVSDWYSWQGEEEE